MPLKKLVEYLDSNGVKFIRIRHSIAYTAQETAASAHIPGKELAKTVIVQVDGKMAMAVVPASHHVDVFLLQEATGTESVILATEDQFKDLFPESVTSERCHRLATYMACPCMSVTPWLKTRKSHSTQAPIMS